MQVLWHTVTIDEGHRLKNEASSLCGALGRLQAPFRVLLTGTPLQNNLHELWALLHFLLPKVFTVAGAKAIFEDAVNLETGQVCCYCGGWRQVGPLTPLDKAHEPSQPHRSTKPTRMHQENIALVTN